MSLGATSNAGAGFAGPLPPRKDGAQMQSRSHANGKIGKILVVEDYEPIRDMICEALRENGYEPVPAASIAEATDILFAEQPAVVITDLFMPGDDVSFISALKR